jgi:DNA-binding GntR family transcriptional regulator
VLRCGIVKKKLESTSPAESRVSETVTKLRQAIFRGELTPGTPLRELTLAREWAVSQATVRDALQRLEHAGLVTRKPNLGATVTRLSPRDVRERVRLRALLEITAAEAAATRMTEPDFAELELRLQVLGEAVASDRYYEAAQADLDFHRFVWQCSGNEMLCRLLELVTVPLFAFISIMRSHGLQRLTTVVEAHEPLIAALRARDMARIRHVFERGVTSSYEPYLDESGERLAAEAFGFLCPPSREAQREPRRGNQHSK